MNTVRRSPRLFSLFGNNLINLSNSFLNYPLKAKRHLMLLVAFLAIAPGVMAQKAEKIEFSGEVVEQETGEPILGAQVKLVEAYTGAVSLEEGKFSFKVAPKDTFYIKVQRIGYETKTLSITQDELPITVRLKSSDVKTDEIVVSASRRPESYKSSPVTVERMSLQDLKQSASLSLFDAATNMKAVDQFAQSMTFKTFNTRGYNSRANTRVVVRQDGMDMQAPGLNFPVNSLFGTPEVDVESVELLPGASSALYGPNAVNGLMNIQSKNPFDYPGVTASARVGANHFDSEVFDNPQPLGELQLRYAKSFDNKFAFKVTGKFFRANDWAARDFRDEAQFDSTFYRGKTNPNGLFTRANPGYDGINIYGDEIAQTFDSAGVANAFGFPYLDGPTRISRNGWTEQQIGSNEAEILNGGLSLHFRPTDQLELILENRAGTGNAVYQGSNRYQLKDFIFHAHRFEVKGQHWFARAYALREDAGNSFDTRLTGVGVERAWKSDAQWFGQYLFAYGLGDGGLTNSILNNLLQQRGMPRVPAGDHQAARAFANSNNQFLESAVAGFLGPETAATLTGGSGRPDPDSERFQEIVDSVRSTPMNQGGGQFIDRTWFYHTTGQYDFSHLFDIEDFHLIGGASFRQFHPESDGVIFTDSAGNDLSVWEYGAYGQAEKSFINERLKTQLSLRVDQNQNTEILPSPRASVVLNLGERRKHYIRANYQRAFRMPDLQAQFIDFDVQTQVLIGGHPDVTSGYGLRLPEGQPNAYTLASFSDYQAAPDSVANPEQLLQLYEAEDLKAEQLNSFTVGYRTTLFNRLSLDAEYYYNIFDNFIEQQLIIGPDPENLGPDSSIRLTATDIDSGSFRRLDRYENIDRSLYSHGFSVGFNYALTDKYNLTGNYNFNEMIMGLSSQEYPFNTPRHKFNVGLNGQDVILQNLGFSTNFRWVEGFDFIRSIGQQPVPIDTYYTLDARISYTVPDIRTTFTLGGTNVLNRPYENLFGAPTVRGLYYFQVNFDQFLGK